MTQDSPALLSAVLPACGVLLVIKKGSYMNEKLQ